MPTNKICPHCGSENIGQESTVSWNMAGQYWQDCGIYDCAGFCRDCDAQEFEPLDCEAGEESATFAAHKAGWRRGGDFGGFWYNSKEFDSWKAAASADEAETYGSAREVCEAYGLVAEACDEQG